VCEARDPKHHYQRARAGEIKDFTGVSAPYEEPHDADLILDTAALPVDASVERVCALLGERGITPRPG
jgi:adenylylsulfate kinase-like enzyme